MIWCSNKKLTFTQLEEHRARGGLEPSMSILVHSRESIRQWLGISTIIYILDTTTDNVPATALANTTTADTTADPAERHLLGGWMMTTTAVVITHALLYCKWGHCSISRIYYNTIFKQETNFYSGLRPRSPGCNTPRAEVPTTPIYLWTSFIPATPMPPRPTPAPFASLNKPSWYVYLQG